MTKSINVAFFTTVDLDSRELERSWGFQTVSPQDEGVRWALKRSLAKNPGVLVPIDSKCEDCYKVWVKSFQDKSWEVLCEDVKRGGDVRTRFDAAKAQLQQGGETHWDDEFVEGIDATKVQVTRSFIGVTESELKRMIGTERLEKNLLACLRAITTFVPETGKIENLYLFKNPKEPHRLVTLTAEMGNQRRVQHLNGANHLYEQQGATYWEHFQQSTMKGSGQRVAMTQVGFLPDLDMWVHTQQGILKQEAEALQNLISDDESEAQLEGPAAVGVGLRRGRSSSSMLDSGGSKKKAKRGHGGLAPTNLAGAFLAAGGMDDDGKAETDMASSAMTDSG